MQSEANSQCPSDLLGVSSAKLYRHRVEPAIVGCRRASLSPLVGIGHLRLASLVDERVPRYSNRLFPDDEEARRFAAGVQAVFVRQQIKVDGLLFFPFGRYCNDDMGATTAAARERIMASVYGYMASVARIPAIEDGECLRLLCVAADAAIFESGLGEVKQRAAAHDLAALLFLPTIMQANHRRVKAIGLSRSLARMSAKDMLAKAATIGASAGAPCGDGWLQILRVLHGEDRACEQFSVLINPTDQWPLLLVPMDMLYRSPHCCDRDSHKEAIYKLLDEVVLGPGPGQVTLFDAIVQRLALPTCNEAARRHLLDATADCCGCAPHPESVDPCLFCRQSVWALAEHELSGMMETESGVDTVLFCSVRFKNT